MAFPRWWVTAGKTKPASLPPAPVAQAARIQAPVMLVHGGKDRRVPIENSQRMRAALERAGRKVEWVLYPNEGHGFEEHDNEIDYWRRIEAFLGQHLK